MLFRGNWWHLFTDKISVAPVCASFRNNWQSLIDISLLRGVRYLIIVRDVGICIYIQILLLKWYIVRLFIYSIWLGLLLWMKRDIIRPRSNIQTFRYILWISTVQVFWAMAVLPISFLPAYSYNGVVYDYVILWMHAHFPCLLDFPFFFSFTFLCDICTEVYIYTYVQYIYFK